MLCSLPHDRYKSSEAATIAHYGSTIGLNPLWIKFWPRFYIVVLGITFNSILFFLILFWILLSLFYLEFSVSFLIGLLFPFSIWTFLFLFIPQSRSHHGFLPKFLTATLHHGLRNDFLFHFSNLLGLLFSFLFDFYSSFPFGLYFHFFFNSFSISFHFFFIRFRSLFGFLPIFFSYLA